MSLCNCFRFFAVGLILAMSTTCTTAYSLRRTTTIGGAKHPITEESRPPTVTVPRRLNENHSLDPLKEKVTSTTTAADTLNLVYDGIADLNHTKSTEVKQNDTKIHLPNVTHTGNVVIFKKNKFQSKEVAAPPRTPYTQKKINSELNTPKKMLNSKNTDTESIRKLHSRDLSDIEIASNINENPKLKISPSITDKRASVTTFPPWKKYTVINRSRSLSENIYSNKDILTNLTEITHSASSLRDTITSDIPSLEKLKHDLISATSKITHISESEKVQSGIEGADNDSSKHTLPMEGPKKISSKINTVQSMRAGYLNFSDKNKDSSELRHTIEENVPSSAANSNPKETIVVNQVDKEKIEPITTETSNNMKNPLNESNSQISMADIARAKLTSGEKIKNASLYTVSPNYKPLKKLEVTPPKSFMRDPDDNSWRNESISSLGIVFKPKNSSKPFTQVLKNKTETEWNNVSEKDRKNDVPDLRERLEQMARMRKTKRKKVDSLGNVVYVDYEENSSSIENLNTPQEEITLPVINMEPQILLTPLNSPSTITTNEPDDTDIFTTAKIEDNSEVKSSFTRKPKKFFNVPDYYESTDEEDTDYLNLAKIDLKKSPVTQKVTTNHLLPSTLPADNHKNAKIDAPKRKGTIQYFPPLTTTKKDNVNKYTTSKIKSSELTTNKSFTPNLPMSYPETTKSPNNLPSQYHTFDYTDRRYTTYNTLITNKPTTIKDNAYLSQPPRLDEQSQYKIISDEGDLNSGSYVIKNYENIDSDVNKDSDFDKNFDYVPFSEAPVPSIIANEVIKEERDKNNVNFNDDFDYDAKFRKDVLDRFVDNFNRHSERYKSEFPVIFNSSIVHHSPDDGREVASSRAFLRGLYEVATKPNNIYKPKPYDPNCENITVELSPAYELHYFVPEQEEKEQAQPGVTLPYRYNL